MIGLLKKWFGRRSAPRSLQSATKAWEQDYQAWLDSLQRVFSEFPDHERFSNVTVDEKTAALLDEIVKLYTEDARKVVEVFVLRGESLRRHLERSQREQHD